MDKFWHYWNDQQYLYCKCIHLFSQITDKNNHPVCSNWNNPNTDWTIIMLMYRILSHLTHCLITFFVCNNTHREQIIYYTGWTVPAIIFLFFFQWLKFYRTGEVHVNTKLTGRGSEVMLCIINRVVGNFMSGVVACVTTSFRWKCAQDHESR